MRKKEMEKMKMIRRMIMMMMEMVIMTMMKMTQVVVVMISRIHLQEVTTAAIQTKRILTQLYNLLNNRRKGTKKLFQRTCIMRKE